MKSAARAPAQRPARHTVVLFPARETPRWPSRPDRVSGPMRDGRNRSARRNHRKDTAMNFDGFPYLNIRVTSALYHVILLPAGVPETQLFDAARRQALANRLPVCLVLA